MDVVVLGADVVVVGADVVVVGAVVVVGRTVVVGGAGVTEATVEVVRIVVDEETGIVEVPGTAVDEVPGADVELGAEPAVVEVDEDSAGTVDPGDPAADVVDFDGRVSDGEGLGVEDTSNSASNFFCCPLLSVFPAGSIQTPSSPLDTLVGGSPNVSPAPATVES